MRTGRTVNDTIRKGTDQLLASSADAAMSPLTSASPPYAAVWTSLSVTLPRPTLPSSPDDDDPMTTRFAW